MKLLHSYIKFNLVDLIDCRSSILKWSSFIIVSLLSGDELCDIDYCFCIP